MAYTIAVTGPAGHIGTNLVRALIELGHQPRVLIYDNPHPIQRLGLSGIRGDVLNPSCLEALFEGVDIVFHLAGKISIDGDPDGSVMQINVEGTKNVVDAAIAKKVKRLIHFSSIHTMQQEPLDEELDERRSYVGDTAFIYDQAACLAEKEVLKGIERGLDAVILIPTAIIGPYDFKPSLIGKALIDFYNGKVPSLVPGGFDWVDVRDVVKTALTAIEKGVKGQRYILSGTWLSTQVFSQLIQEVTGKKVPRFITPLWLAKLSLPLAKAYGKLRNHPTVYTKEAVEVLSRCNSHIKSRKAVKELSHSVRPLKDTLRDTFDWFKSEGMVK